MIIKKIIGLGVLTPSVKNLKFTHMLEIFRPGKYYPQNGKPV